MFKCWQFNRRHRLSLYATGDLSAEEQRRIEDHLTDCGACRDRIARIRAGHQFARQLPPVAPQSDVWDAIEASIDRLSNDASDRAQPSNPRTALQALAANGRWGVAAVAVVLIAAGSLFWLNARHVVPDGEAGGLKSLQAVDRREFAPVRIDEIERNTKPHVVAEGYVSEIRVNDEDGDLSFKLVDDLNQQQRFIVCEIIDPIKLAAPTVGSRVRVYGVSRYDSERDHNWYEVHPVLNIELLRQPSGQPH